MPIVRDFLYETSDENGLTGLKPLWFPNADPTFGDGVAHDTLEHFKSETSILEGESEAIGSFVLLRLLNPARADTRSVGNKEQALCNDVREMLRGAGAESFALPRAIATRPLADRKADSIIVEGVRLAFRGESAQESLMEEADISAERAQELLTEQAEAGFIAWIRRGYRRALKRYGDTDYYTVGSDLFDAIAKRVDKVLASGHLWSGARVRLSVDPMQCSFKLSTLDGNRWLDSADFV